MTSSAQNFMDDTYFKLKVLVNYCSASPEIEKLDLILKRGEDLTTRAYYMSSFASRNSAIPGRLEKAAENIGKIRGGLGRVKNLCSDASAVTQIIDAVAVLNDWAAVPQKATTEEAAEAFDNLFGGAAAFAAKLPAPFNAYAKLLEQCHVSHFFSNMGALMDPMRRPNSDQMREALRD